MSISIVLLFMLIIVPLSLLVHEFGHIFAAKVKKASKIHLNIGSGKRLANFTAFDIKVFVRLFYIVGSYTSTIREKPFQLGDKIFITIMGPVFNGVLALLMYVIYSMYNDSTIILLTLLFNLWLFVVNLIPYKFGMKQSDGYIIYQLLFNEDTTK